MSGHGAAPVTPRDGSRLKVAIVAAPEGLRLYVISDDNYRNEQRTILLAFDLNEKAPETGASSKPRK